MKKLDTMLVRMVRQSIGQYIAVLTIIVMGVLIYVAMSMAADNMDQTLKTYYKQTNFADLFVSARRIPDSEISKLTEIPGVSAEEGRISFETPFLTSDPNERVNVRIVSTKFAGNAAGSSADELNQLYLIEGSGISDESRDAVVLDQFAEARNIKPGDQIQVQINGLQCELNVSGIAASPEYIYLMENEQTLMPNAKRFGVIYISEQLAQQVFGFEGSCNEVVLKLQNASEKQVVIDELKTRLKDVGLEGIVERKDQPSNSMISQEITQLNSMSSSLPVLFLLIAGLILAMMLGRMVKRDRIKIGILKATGYSGRQVLGHYAKYAGSAGIVGGFAGSVLGMFSAGAMTKLYLTFFNIPILQVNFNWYYVVGAMVLSGIFCIAAGVIGAWGSLKVAPAEAMRADVPKAGRRILLQRISFVWKRLSFSWKLVYKNIFRNKKRSIFVLAGVVVTYGMMLFTATMPIVMDDMTNRYFTEFQKMDYSVSFRIPIRASAVRDVSRIVEVSELEGKLEYPFELSNGSRKQAVAIVGLSADTQFYTFLDQLGQRYRPPSDGILLSENLAGFLDVKKGDELKVKTFLSGREDSYIRVAGVIKQTLGMNAYMEIGAMGEKLLDRGAVNGVYLNSDDPELVSELLKASNVAGIQSTADMKKAYQDMMGMKTAMIGFMVMFSGILGFCIVYNATVVSLGEREGEFATLRVLGFDKLGIFSIILRENLVLVIVGMIFGIPVGKVMAEYSSSVFSTKMYTLDMSPTIEAGMTAAVFTVIFMLLAQGATYRKIKRLDFLQSLKNRES